MTKENKTVAFHSAMLVATVFAVYIWLSSPFLTQYSMQAFAIAAIGYFVIKRVKKAKLWHILPEDHSYEMVFVTFAILLLIGATGNAESIFYPFSYIHLFLLVMTAKEQTAIIVTTAVVIFHYAIEPTMTAAAIATIMTLPLMLLFFLFAKKQYDEAELSRSIIVKEEEEIKILTTREHNLESFISTFLRPKLEIILDMLTPKQPDETIDPEAIKMQLALMETESEKILEKAQQKGEGAEKHNDVTEEPQPSEAK